MRKIVVTLIVTLSLIVWQLIPVTYAAAPGAVPVLDYCMMPWEWAVQPDDVDTWIYPGNTEHLGHIDLRTYTQQATAGGVAGWGLFAYSATQTMPLFGDCYGANLDASLTRTQINNIQIRMGRSITSLQAVTLRGIVEELLTVDADPTEATGPKPVVPHSTHLKTVIYLGDTERPIINKRIVVPGAGVYWDKLIERHQLDYEKLRARNLTDGENTYQKWHQVLIDKYRIDPRDQTAIKEFVPLSLRNEPDTNPRPSGTIATESWPTDQTTISSGQDIAWTEDLGDVEVVSGEVTTTDTSRTIVVSTSDNVSDDAMSHESSLRSTNTSNLGGIYIRAQSSGAVESIEDGYGVETFFEGATFSLNLREYNAGVRTTHATDTVTYVEPMLTFVQSDSADSLTGSVAAVALGPVTDSTITGNLKCGFNLRGENNAGDIAWDDHTCQDIPVGRRVVLRP